MTKFRNDFDSLSINDLKVIASKILPEMSIAAICKLSLSQLKIIIEEELEGTLLTLSDLLKSESLG